MYEKFYNSNMGCSVREVAGMSNQPDSQKLKEFIHPGLTLCVTTSVQKSAADALKKAGYFPLLVYTNKAHGHNSRCTLWAAVKDQSKPSLLPDSSLSEELNESFAFDVKSRELKTLMEERQKLEEKIASLTKETTKKETKEKKVVKRKTKIVNT